MEITLVTIARFTDSFEAELAKELLIDQGINAFLKNVIVHSMLPGIFPGKFDVELQVASQDSERAKELVTQRQGGSRVKNLLISSGAILEGHFQLTSGKHSGQYVEKIRLLQDPIATEMVCGMLAEALEPFEFDTVVGPAYGGIVLAFEVARMLEKTFIFTQRKDGIMTIRSGFDLESVKKAVVIEDILTTGNSVREVISCLQDRQIEVQAVAGIVDRSSGAADFGVPFVSLLQMEIPVWLPEECPLCTAGQPLVKPGASDKKI